ncbi:beta-N-acetylhexosaminidase [Dermabacteraceae bacterium P13077]
MSDPVSIVPRPQSVIGHDGEWLGTKPWETLRARLDDSLGANEYLLSVTSSAITLRAGSESALADGKNTFAQIIDGAEAGVEKESGLTRYRIPCLEIRDQPKYAWRGLMIDVARHFVPLDQLKKMASAMALHRLNVLHLHLTDDQGWRIEIDGYPRLTEVGAWREQTMTGRYLGEETPEGEISYTSHGHGGFYTQDELREFVSYAAELGITVVPEIDLPGHMQAAIAAYPSLGNNPDTQLKVRETWGISKHVLGTGDAAFNFVRDVLEQVCDIFPGPYVHIGGDECPTDEWEASPEAQRRLREWGLERTREIQGRFTQHAADVLRKYGKRLVGWDELLEAHLPDDALIVTWRPDHSVAEATARRFQSIVADSNRLYFDHAQGGRREPLSIGGKTTLKDVYTYDPVPAELPAEERSLILGVQGQLWSEYITTSEQLEYMAFPRVCALAEIAWGSPRVSYREFLRRLRPHLQRLERRGINYRPLS